MFPQVQERNLLKIQLHSDNKNNVKCDKCGKFQEKFLLRPMEWSMVCVECNRQMSSNQSLNYSNNTTQGN